MLAATWNIYSSEEVDSPWKTTVMHGQLEQIVSTMEKAFNQYSPFIIILNKNMYLVFGNTAANILNVYQAGNINIGKLAW